jgi:hypothetical protein
LPSAARRGPDRMPACSTVACPRCYSDSRQVTWTCRTRLRPLPPKGDS